MPRGECTFRKRDLKAAVLALEESGKHVIAARIKPDGEIVVETLPGAIDVPMQNAYTQRDRIEPIEGEDDPWDKRLKELHYRK